MITSSHPEASTQPFNRPKPCTGSGRLRCLLRKLDRFTEESAQRTKAAAVVLREVSNCTMCEVGAYLV
jgi:hypothetical protein